MDRRRRVPVATRCAVKAFEVVERQIEMVNGLLHGLVDGMAADEWLWRPRCGPDPARLHTSHIPATTDWAINTWILNREDVRHRRMGRARGHGMASAIGMRLAEADTLARDVSAAETFAYADAVLEDARAWLRTVRDDDLERVPETHAHQSRRAEYRSRGYEEEVEGMHEQRYWRLLSGACVGHCRGHLGRLTSRSV